MILEKLFEKYDKIIFFDTETTGLDATQEQIIELGVIALDREGNRTEIDRFIRLFAHESLPDEIVKLTGITDGQLAEEGWPEEEIAREFMLMFGEKTLLVAYNAQFDLDFIAHAVIRSARDQLSLFNTADYLDPLTVYRDRASYPHKLCNAIEHYNLDEENTHRAIDDAKGLLAVTMAMEKERNDVWKYINLFGYNPKYGLPERKFKGVTYHPQPYGKPKLPYEILPYKAGLIKKESK